MNIQDVIKKYEQSEVGARIRMVESIAQTHGATPYHGQTIQDVIRSSIQTAFNETRVDGGSVQGLSSLGGPVDNLDEAHGYNHALTEVKQRQDEFMKGVE